MAPKQLPIRLPDDVRRRLDAEATRLGLSLNAVIVMILDRHLPSPGTSPVMPVAPSDPDDDDGPVQF
jgi:antitoxin component of RelBE/YafQ-DinJ toxin-antitoxin module